MHDTENRDSHIPDSQRPTPGSEHTGAFLNSKGSDMALA